jgi:nuclear pore complex protein Nup133
LREAVYAYMKEVGEGHHDDFMRAFFRLRVHDIGELTSWMLPILNRVRAEAPSLPALGPTLAEANRIVLVRQLRLLFDFWY